MQMLKFSGSTRLPIGPTAARIAPSQPGRKDRQSECSAVIVTTGRLERSLRVRNSARLRVSRRRTSSAVSRNWRPSAVSVIG